MKKYLFGILAIALAIGFSAFTTTKHINKTNTVTAFFWYPVDPSTNLTTDVYTYNDTKANVIAVDACKDDALQPICLFGSTNSSLAQGTNVGSPDAAHRILQKQ